MPNNMTSIVFSIFHIPDTQVFLLRKNVFAMVNLKPIAPGHVLLCTRRVVPRLEQLDEQEVYDLFTTAQQICQKLQSITHLDYDITIQNGAEAGQTVKHLHMHIVPKHKIPGIQRLSDAARSQEDMAEEAAKYRPFFEL